MVVDSVDKVNTGDVVRVILHDGEIKCSVKDIEKKEREHDKLDDKGKK